MTPLNSNFKLHVYFKLYVYFKLREYFKLHIHFKLHVYFLSTFDAVNSNYNDANKTEHEIITKQIN